MNQTQTRIKTFLEKAHQNLLKKGKPLQYLRKRGISDSQIKKYKFGYFPNGKMGVKEFDDWTFSGKKLKDRIIFPLTNSIGKYKAIGTRLIDKKKGRYLYYYFDRVGANFFGIENLEKIYKEGFCFLTEGIFDHLVLEQVYENSLCLLTANIKYEHLRFLQRFVNGFIMAFDADQTGAEKMNSVSMDERFNHLAVYQLTGLRNVLPGKTIKDLNHLYKEAGPKKFKEFIESKTKLFVI